MRKNTLMITGFAGTGKTTAATYLKHNYGYSIKKFAGPLKDMLRAIGLSDDELEGDLKEEPSDKLCGVTPRNAMQTLGTEWGRGLIAPQIWVNIWGQRVLSSFNSCVSDDTRFLNEWEYGKSIGAKTIRVTRDVGKPMSHGSEKEISEISADYVVDNNGSITELFKLLDVIVRNVNK